MNDELIKSVILGTAGHIDHGKSSLVKALTGIDPDRLKEEKERGITIDLGFASLSYPEGLTVGIVDVPGHERLIKNMLAGAGGIDIVLMVIAADEGIMPQSHEHLAICGLLNIKAGIVALTKADLVDEEWLKLVAEEVRAFVKGTFLENADIIPVSAKTGLNLDRLKETIKNVAHNVMPKLTGGLFRMPIDRVFTLKGFGTVVTGTAVSGIISIDSPAELLPSKINSKVRGLQSHGRSVEKGYAGQRIGINLQGIDRLLLKRGDVVVPPDRFVPTGALDAELRTLNGAPLLKSRSLVHFYTGTSETVARVIIYDADELKPGGSCYCQFRLEDPVVALSGDRYIIRRFSPLETIGGGEILDPYPVRRKRGAGTGDLAVFKKGTLKEKIEVKVKRAHFNGCSASEIEGWIQAELSGIKSAIEQLVNEGIIVKSHDILFHRSSFASFRDAALSFLGAFHKDNPLKPGMLREELKAKLRAIKFPVTGKGSEKVFNSMLDMVDGIVAEKELLRLGGFKAALSDAAEGLKGELISMLDKEGFQPSFKAEIAQKLKLGERELTDILNVLTKEGALVRINDSIYITSRVYNEMLVLMKDFYSKKSGMTIAEFRDILNTSRKYALPFLEYLDSRKITLRVGDIRKLMLK